jgi:DNA-binding transcriptional regulator YhcF (GntR family)
MARPKKEPVITPQSITKAIDPAFTPAKFKLGEIGATGLMMFTGITADEAYRELTWPQSARTYKKMSYHTAVNSCLSLYDNIISKVQWRIVPPENATAKEIKQSKFIESCLGDMESSFKSVIRDCLSSNVYGFAILEKVYRKRYKSQGSLYDDGLIGLKKLALRTPETIERFIVDYETNEIMGVRQNLGLTGVYSSITNQIRNIPKSKYMHVTTGRSRADPFGKSPLRDVYLAWRYLEVVQELEAAGLSKDLNGIPVLKVPAQYLSADASPDQQLQAENFKNIARNLQAGAQAGVLLPSSMDEQTRTPLFDLQLLSTQGGQKQFDTSKIKEYYVNQVYTAMHADILIQGQSTVGSYSLAQVKSTLTGAAVEQMLTNIADAFQRDVIRQIYELNGYDISRLPTLDYEGVTEVDLDTLSKAYQRLASTGMIEKDRTVLNAVRRALGVDPKPQDEPPNKDELGEVTSRSGDGLKSAGFGTSNSVTGADHSSNNLDNAP